MGLPSCLLNNKLDSLFFNSALLHSQKNSTECFVSIDSFCQKRWLLKTDTVLLNLSLLTAPLSNPWFIFWHGIWKQFATENWFENYTNFSGCFGNPLISQSSSLHKFSGNLLQPSLAVSKFLELCCQQADKFILKQVSCLGCYPILWCWIYAMLMSFIQRTALYLFEGIIFASTHYLKFECLQNIYCRELEVS